MDSVKADACVCTQSCVNISFVLPPESKKMKKKKLYGQRKSYAQNKRITRAQKI